MLALTMRHSATIRMGGLESFLALQDEMARIDVTGTECVRGVGITRNEGKRRAVFIAFLLTTAFLMGCDSLGAAHIGLDSSVGGRERASRVETAGVGGLSAAVGTGEHVLVFNRLLLTAAFLTGCCIGFNTAGKGGFVLPFEGQGSTSCTAMAGSSFGNEMVANCKGERVNLLVCFLLMTVLFIDRFIDRITSA